MNLGRQDGIRSPCAKGHAWVPICAEIGRPGFTHYHCPVCGEHTAMKGGDLDTQSAPVEDRLSALEREVAALKARLD